MSVSVCRTVQPQGGWKKVNRPMPYPAAEGVWARGIATSPWSLNGEDGMVGCILGPIGRSSSGRCNSEGNRQAENRRPAFPLGLQPAAVAGSVRSEPGRGQDLVSRRSLGANDHPATGRGIVHVGAERRDRLMPRRTPPPPRPRGPRPPEARPGCRGRCRRAAPPPSRRAESPPCRRR